MACMCCVHASATHRGEQVSNIMGIPQAFGAAGKMSWHYKNTPPHVKVVPKIQRGLMVAEISTRHA